jgi:predicted PP-loop superfamily ATPase
MRRSTFLAGDAAPPYRIYVEEKGSGMKAEMAVSWGADAAASQGLLRWISGSCSTAVPP